MALDALGYDEEEAAAAAVAALLAEHVLRARRPRVVVAPPRRFKAHEETVRTKVAGHLRRQKARILKAIEGDADGVISDADLPRLELAIADEADDAKLARDLADALGRTAKLAGSEGLAVVQDARRARVERAVPPSGRAAARYEDTLEQVNEEAVSWARQYSADRVTAIQQTTRDDIRAAVLIGIQNGDSVDDLAESIQGLTAFSDYRSEMIARTELAFANVQGNLIAYRATGVQKKEWITDPDEPCESCQALSGQVVGIDEQFSSPDYGSLDGPPAHPNCECDVVPVVAEGDVAGPEPVPQPAPPPPPPEPPEPAPPPKPPEPPAGRPTVRAPIADKLTWIREEMGRAAVDIYGEGGETHNVTIDLDRKIGRGLAHRTWEGEIQLNRETSAQLKRTMDMVLRGEQLDDAALTSLNLLNHETIHGMGMKGRVSGVGAAPTADEISYGRAARAYYQTPAGRVLEEGATELLAVHTTRDMATQLGAVLPESPMLGHYRFVDENGRLQSFTSYSREVGLVERLCQRAAGDAGANGGEMSDGARDVLRGLHTQMQPGDRAGYLAGKIARDFAEDRGLDDAMRARLASKIEALIEQRIGPLVEQSAKKYEPVRDMIGKFDGWMWKLARAAQDGEDALEAEAKLLKLL